jgi:hypothetical protein
MLFAFKLSSFWFKILLDFSISLMFEFKRYKFLFILSNDELLQQQSEKHDPTEKVMKYERNVPVNPIMMNSNIYFIYKRKLYIIYHIMRFFLEFLINVNECINLPRKKYGMKQSQKSYDILLS